MKSNIATQIHQENVPETKKFHIDENETNQYAGAICKLSNDFKKYLINKKWLTK